MNRTDRFLTLQDGTGQPVYYWAVGEELYRTDRVRGNGPDLDSGEMVRTHDAAVMAVYRVARMLADGMNLPA